MAILLDIPDDAEDQSPPPTLILHVRYPEAYPDEAPILDLSPLQNAASHPRFDFAADKDQLLSSLHETIQENIGMAMIFTLITQLKETAEQLMADRKEEEARAHQEEILAAEREENKKFHGTLVTPETFSKWREGFMKEMEEKQQREKEERLAELKKAKVKEEKKLTGKQLWERGLAGKTDEGDEDDGLAEGVEKLKTGAS